MKVTNYMTKKWSKAIFEIAIAIILMIFGTKALQFLPAQAQIYDMFWFMYILLWFIIIVCLVFAFVNIAQSMIGKQTRYKLDDITEKLESIENRLGSGNYVLNPTPSDAIVPPPPEDLDRPSKRTVIVVLAVTAALLSVAGIAGFVVFGIQQLPAGGQSPEQAFDQLISAMNNKNAVGVVDQTLLAFSDNQNRSQAIGEIQQMLSSLNSFHVTVNYRNVIQKMDLTQAERDNITSMIGDIEQALSVDIADYCVIEYNITVSMDQGQMFQQDRMPAFLINGAWYLMFEFADQGGQSGPEQTFNMFIERMNNHDAMRACDLTVWKFDKNFTQMVSDFNDKMFSGTFTIVVSDFFVKQSDQFDQSENDLMNDATMMINQKYKQNINDFRLIYYHCNITNDTGTYQESKSMPCVRIDNTWLLVLPDDSSGPQTVTFSLSKNQQGGNYNISIIAMNGGSPPSSSDVFITTIESGGKVNISMRQLNSIPLGNWFNGTMFNDTFDNSHLNVGDYFLLIKSIYDPGSIFRLTDSTGTQKYAEITI